MHHFEIYRFDPDSDAAPRMQTYDLEVGDGERMLLDVLVRLKEIDPSLSYRRSCREGVCGSDAMNINASCAAVVQAPARASGGTPTNTSVRRDCCRPIASWSTAATRRPAGDSTTWRIPTACFAAERS
jgi:hypothetical protein